MRKYIQIIGILSILTLSCGCMPDRNGPGKSEHAPGHDPNGPGNSEHAPGHNKANKTPPGQKKKNK